MADRVPRSRRSYGPLFDVGRQLLSHAPTPPVLPSNPPPARKARRDRWRGGFWVGAVLVSCIGVGFWWGLGDGRVDAGGDLSVMVVPPAYTHRASIVLTSSDAQKQRSGGFVEVPDNSRLEAQFEGAVPPSLEIDNQAQPFEKQASDVFHLSLPLSEAPSIVTVALKNGWHRLGVWRIRAVPDDKPRVVMTAPPQITKQQTVRLSFEAADDYGVRSVAVRVRPMDAKAGPATERVIATPDLPRVRRVAFEDLTGLPYAGARVLLSLAVTDDAGQTTETEPMTLTLPQRTFRNPLARALVEERQKLLAAKTDEQTRNEVVGIMAGMARQESGYEKDPAILMTLRAGAVRLILNPDAATADDVATLMWQVAVRIETGPLGRVQESLRQAGRDLSNVLDRGGDVADALALVDREQRYLVLFLNELLAARAPEPPVISDRAFVLQSEKDYLTREDLRNMMNALRSEVATGQFESARKSLASFDDTLENLSPIAPDLSSAQKQLLQQAAQIKDIAFTERRLRDQLFVLSRTAGRKASVAQRQKWVELQAKILEQTKTLVAMDPESIRYLVMAAQHMKAAQDDMAEGAFPGVFAKQNAALAALEKAADSIITAARSTMLAQPGDAHHRRN